MPPSSAFFFFFLRSSGFCKAPRFEGVIDAGEPEHVLIGSVRWKVSLPLSGVFWRYRTWMKSRSNSFSSVMSCAAAAMRSAGGPAQMVPSILPCGGGEPANSKVE
jgi:hypothetical protein